LAMSLVLALTTVSAAEAAPGTNKAQGIFNRGGWESGGMARSRSSYNYRVPSSYSAPVVQSAPAPMAAQAPEEGRRFSHSPSAPAMNSTPCPEGQAHGTAPAPTVESGRRYSYAPTAEATAPSTPSTQTYYSRPSYYRGGGRSTVDRWALPKTDARKYNSR
jgi:hypothetical protein